MFELNVNKLMNDLVSEDFEVQVRALKDVTAILSALAEQCVKALSVSDNPFLIAERLTGLGTIIVPPLEEFVEDVGEGDSEKKVLGSIVLLNLGSKNGLNNVIAELQRTGKNESLAAIVLMRAKIPEAKDLIIERLRKFSLDELKDIKNSTWVENLLFYLAELSTPLPEDLIESFENIKDSETYKYYSAYLVK